VGKRISIIPAGSAPLAWEAFKARNGLRDSDFTMVQVDFAGALPALIEGRTGVHLGVANGDGARAPILANKPINLLLFSEWNTNSLAHGLVFHQDTIDQNPDVVRRFVEASIRSWEYSIEHPDEAVDALLNAFPTAERRFIEPELELSLPLVQTENSEGEPIGWMAPEDWQTTVLLLADYGGQQSDVPVRDYYSNDFIPAN
jgi:NitT/TauT family transport system substrate-binding protein